MLDVTFNISRCTKIYKACVVHILLKTELYYCNENLYSYLILSNT